MTNRNRIRIAENGICVKEIQFPYRIDRDSVVRGLAYGSDGFIARCMEAVVKLCDAGWVSPSRKDAGLAAAKKLIASPKADPIAVADLFVTVLESAAPEGTRFGTQEGGDESDYCFWSVPASEASSAYPGQGLEDTRENFLDDIIITAVEGGINYWAHVTKYKHPEGGPVSVIIHESTPSGLGRTDSVKPVDRVVKPVARADIEAAIARILDLSVSDETLGLHSSRRDRIRQASAHNDAGNIDDDEADNLMQIAVLGEVVYG